MATPASPTALTLPELLRVTQTAASEVERTEAALVEAKRAASAVIAAATIARNAEMGKAQEVRAQAERVFQQALQSAAATNEAASEAANRSRDAATAAYLVACNTAEPLLRELQRRSERITTLVERSG